MNFSYASAPTTPFMDATPTNVKPPPQQKYLAPPNHAISRATDPLNPISSPAQLQYLQHMVASPPRLAPREDIQRIAKSHSPNNPKEMDPQLPGFYRPSDVFTTPETRHLPYEEEQTQPTQQIAQSPELMLVEEADELTKALSPRTQSAQAGLSLLAASATSFAEQEERTSPFLTARGEDATLMSQPQNSLAHHLSPPLVDRYSYYPPQRLPPIAPMPAMAGRLVQSRSLLRQTSGLTNASFHNDLVPQPTESFFAPLEEVCSEGNDTNNTMAVAEAQGVRVLSRQHTSNGWMPRPPPPPPPPPPQPPQPPQQTYLTVPSPANRGQDRFVSPPAPQPTNDEDSRMSVSSEEEKPAKKPKRRRTGSNKRDKERRFECDICERSFARQYNLKTHRLTHFSDAPEARPFKCPLCPKAFTRKHDLQRHSVLHERSNKYSCDKCEMGFQRKDALKKHAEGCLGL